MKCKFFFRRFDIIRNWSRALIIPYGFFVWKVNPVPHSIAQFIIVRVLMYSFLIAIVIGCFIKVNSKADITQYLSEQHTAFCHSFSTVRQDKMCFLSVAGEENVKYARVVGNRLVFPTTLAVGLEQTPDGLRILTRKMDLYIGKNEDLPPVELRSPIIFTATPHDKDGEYLNVRLTSPGHASYEFIVKSNYEWDHCKKYLTEVCNIPLI